MGNQISSNIRENQDNLFDKVDKIAAKYITELDIDTLKDLIKPETCNKFEIITEKIFKEKVNFRELKLIQRRKDEGNNAKIENAKVTHIFKDDSSLTAKQKFDKKRLCESLALFYVRIAHVYSCIAHTINPIYREKGTKNEFNLYELYGIGSEKQLDEKKEYVSDKYYGFCDKRIQTLMNLLPKPEDSGIEPPSGGGDVIINNDGDSKNDPNKEPALDGLSDVSLEEKDGNNSSVQGNDGSDVASTITDVSEPTPEPTSEPTSEPTEPTPEPTEPTSEPTEPTEPTPEPTNTDPETLAALAAVPIETKQEVTVTESTIEKPTLCGETYVNLGQYDKGFAELDELFKGKIDASARKNSSENSDENDPKSHYEAKYTFPDKDTEGYKDYQKSLSKFYTTYTGESSLPEDGSIKTFSDIKIADYDKKILCDGNNVDLDNNNASNLATIIKDMLVKSNEKYSILSGVLKEIFSMNNNDIQINPNLNSTKLEEQVKKTRETIVELYIDCEKNYKAFLEQYNKLKEGISSQSGGSLIDLI